MGVGYGLRAGPARAANSTSHFLLRGAEPMANILLVDDEPEIRFLARKMLEKAGHTVVEAEDGEECLELLKSSRPDLILMDVRMPGDNGWEICRKIKRNRKTRLIPVVMFTVRTSPESIEKSKRYALADAHINKPFDKEELVAVVEDVLRKSKV
jgi:CheY-like chemotaxis protein